MSDCSTDAIHAKECLRTCGTCDYWRRIVDGSGACLASYTGLLSREVTIRHEDEPCMMMPEMWTPRFRDTIEQVARDMYDFIGRVETDEGDVIAAHQGFFHRLYELGFLS